MADWIFTFGPDHKHPQTGDSLGKSYVRFTSMSEDQARIRMFAVFGRNWASCYTYERGLELAEKYGLHEVYFAHAMFAEVMSAELDESMELLGSIAGIDEEDMTSTLRTGLLYVLSMDRARVNQARIAARNSMVRVFPPIQPKIPLFDDELPLIGERPYPERRIGRELDRLITGNPLLDLWPPSPSIYVDNTPVSETGWVAPDPDDDPETYAEIEADADEDEERARREADAEDGPAYDEGDNDDPPELVTDDKIDRWEEENGR
jgi:hypothetical protein